MKTSLVVAIYMKNSFFVKGLKEVIQEHFNLVDREITFVYTSHGPAVDLVVREESSSEERYPCRNYRGSNGHITPVIVVTDVSFNRLKRRVFCPSELGVLSIKDDTAAWKIILKKFIEKGFRSTEYKLKKCNYCMPHLTFREKQILRGLSSGLTQLRMAKILNLDVKTISAHKRKAMDKLGVKRNSELCHWLRQGGLNYSMNG